MKFLLTAAALALAAAPTAPTPTVSSRPYVPPQCSPPACQLIVLNQDDHMPTTIMPDLALTSVRLVSSTRDSKSVLATTRSGGYAIISTFPNRVEIRIYAKR